MFKGPLKIHRSTRIQEEADKKSLSDLIDEADAVVSPTMQQSRSNAHYDEVVACENILLGMEWMLELCELLRRKSLFVKKYHREKIEGTQVKVKNCGTVGIYSAAINEGLGTCTLFFVGTVASIIKKLNKLDNTWV